MVSLQPEVWGLSKVWAWNTTSCDILVGRVGNLVSSNRLLKIKEKIISYLGDDGLSRENNWIKMTKNRTLSDQISMSW